MSPPDGAAEIRRILADAPEMTARDTWPVPDMRLVEDDRAPAPTLEDDSLPAGWAEWITAEAKGRGCPRDYVAAGLIGAASQWIGNARHVAATTIWCEPPHLWIALIGAPSTGKSPALRPIVEAMRAIERGAEPAWREANARHAARVEAARVIEEGWRESVRDAAKQGMSAADRPSGADVPPPPLIPRVMAMDATTEELQHLLSGQPRGLLYMRDELAGWLGNLDRYGGHGADRAFYIEAWNGGLYVADRVKHRSRPVRIERTSLAILGGMQPDRLREVLTGPEDGLTTRFVWVWPETAPVGPLYSEDAEAGARRYKLISAARRLYALAMDGDPAGEPAPRILLLDPEALRLFDELRREAMQRARSSRGLAAGWHGKTPGRALRLALVYELLGWPGGNGAEPRAVSADAVARAAGYLDYASAMLDRVTAGLAISRAEADAAVIARHIFATRGGTLNERVLYQSPGWAWLRDRGRRVDALRVLVEAGWLRQAASVGSGRPPGDWEVSPRVRERAR
jgi:Protein of unknown function (DUF3987)